MIKLLASIHTRLKKINSHQFERMESAFQGNSMLMPMLLDLAHRQLAQQLDATNSIETKAVGVLAFTGVIFALSSKLSLGALIAIPFVFGIISVWCSIITLRPEQYKNGPDLNEFYNLIIKEPHTDVQKLMWREIANHLASNKKIMIKKSKWLKGALIFLILTAASLPVLTVWQHYIGGEPHYVQTGTSKTIPTPKKF